MTPDEEWQQALIIRIVEARIEKQIQMLIWGNDFEELK